MGRFSKFEWERKNYPVLKDWVYLDHPSSGLIHKAGYQAMEDYLRDRLEHGLSYEDYVSNWRFADALREDIGRMLGCSGEDIAYGYNSSQLLNIFINGLVLQPGDNIVTTELSYDAGRYTLLHQQGRHVEIRFAKANNFATASDRIFALADARTRAIVLSHVEHGTGFRHDLKEIGAFCRERGIWLAVDATQSCGAMQIHVDEMQVDFLTVSCYKWLQSYLGQGFAYVSGPLRQVLRLSDTGWTGEKERFHGEFYPNPSDTARRYECGGINFAGLHSLKASIENYMRLGGEDIQDYILSLTNYFYERVHQDLPSHIRIVGDFSPGNRSSIVVLEVPEGLDDEMAAQSGFRVHCPKPGRMRVGFHYCTNQKDIDKFLAYLKTLK